MKKYLTIFILFFSIHCFAQFPITIKGNDPVQQTNDQGARAAKGGFAWLTNIADTTTANSQPYLKGVPGLAILVNGSQLWIRNQTATMWVQVGGGASSARNGLTVNSGFVELGGAMTKHDTIGTSVDGSKILHINGGAGFTTNDLIIDFSQTGSGGVTRGAVTLDNQDFSGVGFGFIGKDPGNVRNQVENTITPTEAAAASINYGASAASFTTKMTNANIISQWYLGGGQNAFADSSLMIRTTGKSIQFAVDGVSGGSFWFKGSAGNMSNVYGGFQGLGDGSGGSRFGIGTITPGQKLAVIGSGRFTDSLLLTALLTGGASDSILVTSGGVTKRIAQSGVALGQQSRVSSQFDKANATLADITGLTATLVSGKVYRFEATLYTTSNVASGVKFAIAGGATATAIIYEAVVIDNNTNAAQTRAAALATTVGGVTAVTNALCKITGTITCANAGTLTVQFADNTGVNTSSVLVGSVFVVTEIP